MTINESIRKKSFYFIFLIYLTLMAFFGSTNDWDGLLNSSGSNLYSLIIISLHIPGQALIFFNVVIFSYFQFLIYKANKFIFFLVLVNPLFFLNVVDAYNKFVFVIFVYFLLFGFFYNKPWVAYVNLIFMALINPIYAFFSIAIVRFLSKKFLIHSILISIFLLLWVYIDYNNLKSIVFSNEKVMLIVSYGLQSLNFSEGGFGIADEYLGVSLRSVFLRFVGAFFPFFFINNPSFISFMFSSLNFILLISLFFFIRFRFSLFLVLCLLVFTAIMTNYTRAFRHLYVFIIILTILNYYPFLSILNRRRS